MHMLQWYHYFVWRNIHYDFQYFNNAILVITSLKYKNLINTLSMDSIR